MTTTTDAPIYSTLADDPDWAELVEMFVDDVPDRIATIEHSYTSGDRESLRRVAHQLKGAAGSYGFDSVTDVAAQLERAIDTAEPADVIDQATERLIATCQRLRSGTPQ
ncbi:MAG: Hpt domain-containing protein [Pirellulales bacterium]